MKTFEVGQHVRIPCTVQSGMFPNERLVTVETKDGSYSGFVPNDCFWQNENRRDSYIPRLVKNVRGNIYTIQLLGEWLISATMHFSVDWIQKKREPVAVARRRYGATMILSHHDLRKAVKENRIAFDPPLEDYQFMEASIDLRLGFCFFDLQEDLHGIKVSLADGIKTIAAADFSADTRVERKG